MNLKYKTEEIGKGNHADKKASTEMSLHSQKSTEGVSDLGTNVSKPADYYPEYRSGGYAILRAMFEKSQANNFKGT